MREVVITPTYHREELLYCCLKRLRGYDDDIPIHVFPDRGSYHRGLLVHSICNEFEAVPHLVPDNDWYGDTSNVMNAYLWAYNAGYERVFYVEDDVMVHSDFFSWHREQQKDFPDLFASMAWIFNREAPISDCLLFQPWIYSIGLCFSQSKLALIAQHATPKYYGDMPGYLEKRFKNPVMLGAVHWEQDGLLQRILDEDKSQTVSPGIAKCSHLGYVRSYGDGADFVKYEEIMEGAESFTDRVNRIEELIADPYRRMKYFGRNIVEREIGCEIPPRIFRYRMTVGEFETEFTSDLELRHLPRVINSVPRTAETVIESV